MTGITISPPDQTELKQEVVKFDTSIIVRVVDKPSSALAQERYADAGRIVKKIVERFEPTRAAFDKAKKELLALRDGLTAPLELYRQAQKQLLDRFDIEQAAAEAREAARLRALALEEAEQRRIMDVAAAEESGDTQEAEAIADEPLIVPEPVVETQIAAVEGVGKQLRWSAEGQDLIETMREIVRRHDAGDVAWAAGVAYNMPFWNRLAVSMRQNLRFPGVMAVSKIVRPTR